MQRVARNVRLSPNRPIGPTRTVPTQPAKTVPSRDENQDAQIRALQDRVHALEETVAQLTRHISVNSLNELVIQADQNIFLQCNGALQISSAAGTSLSAARVEFNAPLAVAAGVIQTNTIIADNVVGKSYTPGAGNIW